MVFLKNIKPSKFINKANMIRKQSIIRGLIVMALIWLINISLSAQQTPAFWKEIQSFRKADSAAMPAKGQILFVGSSSFTMWKDVQQNFPEHAILNRGFGGSSLPDLIRYAEDVILKYDPKQIVIYCGENDLAASDTVNASIVLQRFQTLFTIIRQKHPEVPIAFISIKPSPSRAHLMPEMVKANEAIRQFLKNEKKTSFIDVYHDMLNAQGAPRAELFISDNLHMNKRGYAIWKLKIQPHLLETSKK